MPVGHRSERDPPFAEWFVGGQLNVAVNCLDRHVEYRRGDRVAYYWEGEPGDRKVITYQRTATEVNRAANALKELGVRRGDRVAIYMPMIPELPVAMLACARIGAPHTVVFGGFSASALADRINDAQAKLVITADGGYPPRQGQRSQGERRRCPELGRPASSMCSSSSAPAKMSQWPRVAMSGGTTSCRDNRRVV